MTAVRMPGHWKKEKCAKEVADIWNRRGDGYYEPVEGTTRDYGRSRYTMRGWVIVRHPNADDAPRNHEPRI